MSATVVMTKPMLRIWICRLSVAGACAEAEKTPAASSSADKKNGNSRLDCMGHSYSGLSCHWLRDGLGAEPSQQMITDTQGVGHDRQRRIDGGARWEKAAVDDIEIFDFVRFTIHVESGRLGIVTEANRAVLVRDTCERNAVAEKQVPREEPFVAVVAVNAAFGLLFHE